MTAGLKIGRGWIYLRVKERNKINMILKAMQTKQVRLVTIQQLSERVGVDIMTGSHLAWLLVACRVLYMEQHHKARLLGLNKGWRKALKITYYNENKQNY